MNSQNEGYHAEEMAAITSYQGQVVCLRQSLFRMHELGVLPADPIHNAGQRVQAGDIRLGSLRT